jgi:phage tail sheath gpL-like
MPAPEIPITGIDATYRIPGTYAEILFAQGPSAASAGPRTVVFVMPMLSTGTWTAGTMYPVNDEITASNGAGIGSPLHRAIRMYLRAGGRKCFALPVAETVSGSPVAATAVLTIATNASGTGTLTVTVCGEDASYTFVSGATPTVIGDGIAASINAKTWLPCTAANASGTVTLTAKLKGISQGTATLGVIRVRANITSGIGTTASFGGAFLGTGAAGAEGSTTEAANTATALANIAASRKYYVVTSTLDATSWGHFITHVTTKAEPRQGMRSVIIAAYTGSLASAQTLATGKNYERLQVVWQPNSEHDTAELVGNMAAVRQKREQTDSAYNLGGYSESDWLIRPAYSETDWPDGDDQNDAINDGLTPIASRDGDTYIVMSVDTRSKNPTGTVDDFRACETHRISVCDEWVDERVAATALNFQGKKLMDDERLADGSVNPNQRVIPGVIRPSYLRKPIFQQLDDYEGAGKLQNIQASKDALRLVKSPANASRVECAVNLWVIDHAHQFTYRVNETSVA